MLRVETVDTSFFLRDKILNSFLILSTQNFFNGFVFYELDLTFPVLYKAASRNAFGRAFGSIFNLIFDLVFPLIVKGYTSPS
jgi:hypothetical protein